MTLRFLTAGESHGPELNIIVEGIPSGLELLEEDINIDLKRRQGGYGRGGRMKIEKDQVIFTGGVRLGKTLGGPISLRILNNDFKNWDIAMSPVPQDINDEVVKNKIAEKFISRVRPGHADLTGSIKYNQEDVRNILERSSARETTSRVVAGAIFKKLLKSIDVNVYSFVTQIGRAALDENLLGNDYKSLYERAEQSEVRCPDEKISLEMIQVIDETRKNKDTVGGLTKVIATGIPVGLGSFVHWDRRINAKIAYALMSVHTVKSVEFGLGKNVAHIPGSKVHDQIFVDPNYSKKSFRYKRKTNNAGGTEGGMTTGEPILCTVATKPIPTLLQPLDSVNIQTKANETAHFERSDICVVPAAGVVLEAMMAYALCDEVLAKFGGDSMREFLCNHKCYQDYVFGR